MDTTSLHQGHVFFDFLSAGKDYLKHLTEVPLNSVAFGERVIAVTYSSVTIGDYDGYTVRENGGTIDLTTEECDEDETYFASFRSISEVRIYLIDNGVTIWDVFGWDRNVTHPVTASLLGKTVLFVEDDTSATLDIIRYVEVGPDASFAIEKEPDDTRYAPSRYAAVAVFFD